MSDVWPFMSEVTPLWDGVGGWGVGGVFFLQAVPCVLLEVMHVHSSVHVCIICQVLICPCVLEITCPPPSPSGYKTTHETPPEFFSVLVLKTRLKTNVHWSPHLFEIILIYSVCSGFNLQLNSLILDHIVTIVIIITIVNIRGPHHHHGYHQMKTLSPWLPSDGLIITMVTTRGPNCHHSYHRHRG